MGFDVKISNRKGTQQRGSRENFCSSCRVRTLSVFAAGRTVEGYHIFALVSPRSRLAYNPLLTPVCHETILRETLTEVWRQVLVEDAKVVELGRRRYPVRKTPRKGLRQVDFALDGDDSRA